MAMTSDAEKKHSLTRIVMYLQTSVRFCLDNSHISAFRPSAVTSANPNQRTLLHC